jgi:hypothetical protein
VESITNTDQAEKIISGIESEIDELLHSYSNK